MVTTTRAERSGATRERILSAAERLFAEQGVVAVSNRQVSDAAGQGNNTAVGYHFGTKADLVRAIVRAHQDAIERYRTQAIAEIGDSTDLRDWVRCLVRPSADHLAELGNPTWYARFAAQVMTDPTFRAIVIEEALNEPSLRQVQQRLNSCLPDLPPEVRAEREDMMRQLIVHTFAERERAIADGLPTPRATWHDAAVGLTDAIVGLCLAPVGEWRWPGSPARR